MRTQSQFVLTIVFALATGVLGTLLFQSHAAEAQAGRQGFSECFAATVHVVDGRRLPPGPPGWRPSETIRVPTGWIPVGGGNNGRQTVVLCR